jgi:hypothetical protein
LRNLDRRRCLGYSGSGASLLGNGPGLRGTGASLRGIGAGLVGCCNRLLGLVIGRCYAFINARKIGLMLVSERCELVLNFPVKLADPLVYRASLPPGIPPRRTTGPNQSKQDGS